jgi:hypothetical protein
MTLWGQRQSTTANINIFTQIYNNAGTYQLYTGYSFNGSTLATLATNYAFSTFNWYHIAIVRNGVNLDQYVNGTKIGTVNTLSTNALFNSTYPFLIGAAATSSTGRTAYFSGWIDELRVVKGNAKWTANFSVPTSEY